MQLTKLPSVPNNGRGALQVDVAIRGPRTEKTLLGSIPAHLPSPEDNFVLGGEQEIYKNQPVLDAKGQPVIEDQVVSIRTQALSSTGATVAGGLAGGAGGVVVGLLGQALAGTGALGTAACALGGAVVGAVLSRNAEKNHGVRLEWREQPIEKFEMDGFHGQATHEGGTYFFPDFKTTQHGTYWKPEVVHFDARTGKEFDPSSKWAGLL